MVTIIAAIPTNVNRRSTSRAYVKVTFRRFFRVTFCEFAPLLSEWRDRRSNGPPGACEHRKERKVKSQKFNRLEKRP